MFLKQKNQLSLNGNANIQSENLYELTLDDHRPLEYERLEPKDHVFVELHELCAADWHVDGLDLVSAINI